MNVNPVPEGFHTVTPYLVAKGADKLLTFLESAFNAEVKVCHRDPQGAVMNAEVRIGNSMLMLAEARGSVSPTPTMLYLYVPDTDAAYAQALGAGGKSIMEPADQFYGDRNGAVEDFSGNQWWIATRKENLSEDEIMKRASEKR